MDNTRPLVDPAEWLFRRGRSKPEKNYMNPDGTATSRVFALREKDNGALSVNVKSMTTAQAAVGDAAEFMLFELANREVLTLNLQTFHDPCFLEKDGFDNPAHAVIVGMNMDDDILPGLLARKSRRVSL